MVHTAVLARCCASFYDAPAISPPISPFLIGATRKNDVAAARDQGFRFLVYTADLWIYQRALRDGLEYIRGSK
jgi:hypothetical protein